MNFKFELGEKVKLINSEKKGEVKGRKFEEHVHKNGTSTIVRYFVNLGGYHVDWYAADKLESLDNHEFTSKFEEGFLDLMIDANLIVRNYDQVKVLSDEKKKR